MHESAEYASAPTLVGVPLPSKARAALALTVLLSVMAVLVAMIVPVIITLVMNRPSKTTALFAGTGATGLLKVRVYNGGGLPSVVEPGAKLQFRSAGLAPAALRIVNGDQTKIAMNGQADLELDIESVWIYAGSTKATVAEALCKATGTLELSVRESDRWGALHPDAPLTVEVSGRQIRDAVMQRMSGEKPKDCVTP
jgi:hypothetical protein